MKKTLLFIFAIAFSFIGVKAQGCFVRGTVYDESGQTVPFAKVSVYTLSGMLYSTTAANIDGEYSITELPTGVYDIHYSSVNYASKRITSVIVDDTKITFLDIKLPFVRSSPVPVIIEPFIRPQVIEDRSFIGTETPDRPHLPQLDVIGPVLVYSGIYSRNRNAMRYDEYSAYFLFAKSRISPRGGSGIPICAIQEVQVILGGIPAEVGYREINFSPNETPQHALMPLTHRIDEKQKVWASPDVLSLRGPLLYISHF